MVFEPHPLLKRQLVRAARGSPDGKPDMDRLLEMVSQAYAEGDSERHLSERAIQLMEGELRAANARLREEAELLIKAVLSNVGDAVIIANEKGIIESVNGAAAAMFATTADGLVGRNLSVLMPAPFSVHHDTYMAEYIRTGVARVVGKVREVSALRADGQVFPVELAVGELMRADGRHFIGIVRDITERLKAQQELRESEQRFRDFASSSSDWFWEMDADLRFTRFMGNYAAVLGPNADKGIGRTRAELIDFTYNPEACLAHLADLEGHRPFRNFVYRTKGQAGQPVYLKVSGRPMFDNDGRFRGYRGTASEVSAEISAAEQIQKLSTAVEQSPAILVITDPTGTIEYVNPKFTEVTGYEREEVIGKPTSLLRSGQTPAGVYNDLWRTIKEGRAWRGEFLNRRKSGEHYWASMLIAPIVSALGEITHYIALQEDITERKEAEEAIRKTHADLERAKEAAEVASRAKSEFLATMSHEIRTPMNGVIGMTGLLLDTELAPQQRHFAETIRESAEALLDIINDILDFSKMEAGRLELEKVPLNLLSLVEGVTDLLAPRAHAKRIEIASQVAPELQGTYLGDAGRIRQILLNLTGNAVKFTEKGGVAVTVGRAGGEGNRDVLRIEVRDTGIGIPPESMSRLFASFSQVDASTARRYGGTGLGLAISKRLAEAMGGRIGVESQAGTGSLFWVEIPLERLADTEPAIPLDQAASLRSRRVLVVDDNDTNREIFHRMLTAWGIPNEETADAPSALAALREAALASQAFDTVLLDMHMPGMSGADLLRVLRGDPTLRSLTVVIASSIQEADARADLDGLAIDAFLVKPVRQSALFDVLAENSSVRRKVQPAPAPKSRSQPNDRRLRILVVEDVPVNQEVAVGLLTNLGHRADVAGNGKEAVEAVRQVPYDLVLMDVQMPEMDGYEATRVIRALPGKAGRVPIVAMTANAMKGDEEKCRLAGMDAYIAKPVERRKLADAITNLFGAEPLAPRAGIREAMDAAVTLNRETLAMLEEDLGRASVVRLIRSFFANTGERLPKLVEMAAAGDTTALAREAHSLKGVAGTLGITSVQEAAKALEEAAREGHSIPLTSICREVELAFGHARTALLAAYPEAN